MEGIRGGWRAGAGEHRAVVPGHPALGVGSGLVRVALESGEVVEGVRPAELAGVDQAHVDVADPGTVCGFVEQGVLAMKDGCNRRSATRRAERQVVSVVDSWNRVVGFLFGFDGLGTWAIAR